MVGSTPPAMSGRVFISYRREETAYAAGWLYDRLARHFGGGQVFKDVDSIQLGDDFVEVITRVVGSCDVLTKRIPPSRSAAADLCGGVLDWTRMAGGSGPGWGVMGWSGVLGFRRPARRR